MMPRKNGYVLCSELKKKKETKDIPIILLTAVGDAVQTTSYSHASGMTLEAEDYIPKPVDIQALIKSIESLSI
jgi:DNA-binding response OmpR family regulator